MMLKITEINADLLKQRAVKKMYNLAGILIGTIQEITCEDYDILQYIILRSNQAPGDPGCFFAIPACSNYIILNSSGEMILTIGPEQLADAPGIQANFCPAPGLSLSPLIYELFNYIPPVPKK